MERAELLAINAADLHRPGQGPERRGQPQRQGAGGRQPRQHQCLHRHEERAGPAAQELHRHAASGPQPCRSARSPPRPARPWPTSKSWPSGATTRPPCTPTTVSPPSTAKAVKDMINDQDWNANTFLPTVGKRGAAIIAARGLSSAASAANAAIDHMRDWALGTNGKWVTMGIPSDGEYGIPKDTMFGFPVTCEGGEYKVVEGLPIDAFSQELHQQDAEGAAGRAGRRRAPAVTRHPLADERRRAAPGRSCPLGEESSPRRDKRGGALACIRARSCWAHRPWGGNSRSVTITAASRRGCAKACNCRPS